VSSQAPVRSTGSGVASTTTSTGTSTVCETMTSCVASRVTSFSTIWGSVVAGAVPVHAESTMVTTITRLTSAFLLCLVMSHSLVA